MDLKKFSKFIIALGIIICLGGGIYFIANKPIKEKGYTLAAGPKEGYNNIIKERKRQNVIPILSVGGIVIFIGSGLLFSANNKKT